MNTISRRSILKSLPLVGLSTFAGILPANSAPISPTPTRHYINFNELLKGGWGQKVVDYFEKKVTFTDRESSIKAFNSLRMGLNVRHNCITEGIETLLSCAAVYISEVENRGVNLVVDRYEDGKPNNIIDYYSKQIRSLGRRDQFLVPYPSYREKLVGNIIGPSLYHYERNGARFVTVTSQPIEKDWILLVDSANYVWMRRPKEEGSQASVK